MQLLNCSSFQLRDVFYICSGNSGGNASCWTPMISLAFNCKCKWGVGNHCFSLTTVTHTQKSTVANICLPLPSILCVQRGKHWHPSGKQIHIFQFTHQNQSLACVNDNRNVKPRCKFASPKDAYFSSFGILRWVCLPLLMSLMWECALTWCTATRMHGCFHRRWTGNYESCGHVPWQCDLVWAEAGSS